MTAQTKIHFADAPKAIEIIFQFLEAVVKEEQLLD
jgi:hypothetical protein